MAEEAFVKHVNSSDALYTRLPFLPAVYQTSCATYLVLPRSLSVPSMSFFTRRKAFAVEKRLSFRHAGRGNGSNAAAYNAYHYPGPMGLHQQPFYNRRYLHAFVINYKNLYLESQIFSEFRFFPLFRKLTSFLSLGCFAFKWVSHVQDYIYQYI